MDVCTVPALVVSDQDSDLQREKLQHDIRHHTVREPQFRTAESEELIPIHVVITDQLQ